MTNRQTRRSAIDKVVGYERGRLQHQAELDIVGRADNWALGMFHALKLFGDGHGDTYLSHFVFDDKKPEAREHHTLVHSSFRRYLGIEFEELALKPDLQAVIGRAELFGWATVNAAGELQTATYEALRVEDDATGVIYQRSPIDLSSL